MDTIFCIRFLAVLDATNIENQWGITMDVREKLVELLKEISYDKKLSWYDLWDMREGAEDIADLLIANGVTVQEWISVKDRLPELHTKVLCCGPKGGVFIAETRTCAGRVLWDDRTRIGKRNVTHWTPLPQPPKGE